MHQKLRPVFWPFRSRSKQCEPKNRVHRSTLLEGLCQGLKGLPRIICHGSKIMMNIAQCTLDLEQIFRLNCSDPVKQERLFLVISGFVYFIMGWNYLYINFYFSLYHNYSMASRYRALSYTTEKYSLFGNGVRNTVISIK